MRAQLERAARGTQGDRFDEISIRKGQASHRVRLGSAGRPIWFAARSFRGRMAQFYDGWGPKERQNQARRDWTCGARPQRRREDKAPQSGDPVDKFHTCAISARRSTSAQGRVRPASRQGSALHQGRSTRCCRVTRTSTSDGKRSARTSLLGRQQALNTAYLLKDDLRPALDYRRARAGRGRFLRQLAPASKCSASTLRALRRHMIDRMARHRRLLQPREQGLARLSSKASTTDPVSSSDRLGRTTRNISPQVSLHLPAYGPQTATRFLRPCYKACCSWWQVWPCHGP